MTKKTIMSGMRPTGRLHLGHFLGVLTNWKKLQNEYNCYFSITDWHALTTNYDKTELLSENIYNVLLDWLSVGIDPNNSTIFLQSMIPEIAELHVYLSMMTPQGWAERDPTLKDMVKIIKSKEGAIEATYGLIGYPILMTADIMSMNADLVPVGKDQVAHIEISRDIIRRFNNLYGTNFNEPEPLLSKVTLLKGVNGEKMGKSFNNDIKISDTEEVTTKKIMTGITDRNRIRKDDKGNPDNCEVIYKYWEIFGSENDISEVQNACREALMGCAECKRKLANTINAQLAPIREKRTELENDKDYLKDVLLMGAKKAQEKAGSVLEIIRKSIRNI